MALFNQKENSEEDNNSETSNYTISQQEKATIYSNSQQQSVMQGGNQISFKAGLEDEYSKFRQKVIDDEIVQGRLHESTRIIIKDKEGTKETQVKQKEQLENKVLKEINDDINKFEQEIIDAPNNPKKYGITDGPDPSTKALFSIGCIILAAVGVFLTIFYISASYSAFYKNWALENDSELVAKLFDGHAFTKAWQIDATAGLIVSLTVFIFLGLGVLIHVFQKAKGKLKWVKIMLLVLITFLFDCLLAYYIESGVYSINKTPLQEPYNISIAIQDLGFWLIIFFGFVTYIIWGLVFDFTMDKWAQFSPLLVFKRGREGTIKTLKIEKKEITKKINDLTFDIGGLDRKIDILNEKLRTAIVPVGRFKHIHSAYTKGWIFGIAGCAINEDIKDKRRNDCQKVADNFLVELNKEE